MISPLCRVYRSVRRTDRRDEKNEPGGVLRQKKNSRIRVSTKKKTSKIKKSWKPGIRIGRAGRNEKQTKSSARDVKRAGETVFRAVRRKEPR